MAGRCCGASDGRNEPLLPNAAVSTDVCKADQSRHSEKFVSLPNDGLDDFIHKTKELEVVVCTVCAAKSCYPARYVGRLVFACAWSNRRALEL